MKKLALIVSVASMVLLCAMSIRAWQVSVSHEELSHKLDLVTSRQGEVISKLSATDEHLKDIDRELNYTREEHISERVTALESSMTTIKDLGVAIVLGLLGLIGERIIVYGSALKKGG
jgi:peptidoglycan hydrolase CwlO-like protein